MHRLLLVLPFALLPLTLAQAAEHAHEHAEHASLSAHEHGVAQLNAALDGQTLELQLESPAMNLVGFEYRAKTAADQASVAAVRAELENPLSLFSLPAAAGCTLTTHELESPLFDTTSSPAQHLADAHDDHKTHEQHAEDSEHDTHGNHTAETTAAVQSQHAEHDEHAQHEKAPHDDPAQDAKNATGQDGMAEESHSAIHAHYQFACSTPAALTSLDLGPLFERFPATQKIQVQLIGPNGQQGLELMPSNSRLNF
ncbi:MAG: DUF2796 domain-containing protein [Pseudomonas sp.]